MPSSTNKSTFPNHRTLSTLRHSSKQPDRTMSMTDAFLDLPVLFRRLANGIFKEEEPQQQVPEPDVPTPESEPGIHTPESEPDVQTPESKPNVQTPEFDSDVDEEVAPAILRPHNDPYVLVLIDCHSHAFTDDVVQQIQNRAESRKLRRQFQMAFRTYFSGDDVLFVQRCRLVVRAFTTLAAAGDTNSISAEFAARFSSVDPFFDMITVLDSEILEDKITEAFDVAVRDPNCKRLLVAAWQRPAYIRMLGTATDKVTVIEGASMRDGYEHVPLPAPMEAFPKLFKKPRQSEVFTWGPCFEDVGEDIAISEHPESGVAKTGITGAFGAADHPVSVLFGDEDDDQVQNDGPLLAPNDAPLLTPNDAAPVLIPINKNHERVDANVRVPSKKVYAEFYEVYPMGSKQPCRRHHLTSDCPFGVNCKFDHSDLSLVALEVLRCKARRVACRDGSSCRRSDCIYGHSCRSKECVATDSPGCSLRCFHEIDPTIAEWVPGSG
ncbi:hypothetical protein OPT61_g2701 [Boeremia exigua]|uniref:Uncharacterized protein n=1 Tax=Boeremia exigua TaxID=749465 RepID=A0ACC2IKQ5_9PLEO|nr:hypothetical protein OPT61_g2701 [Boeremia exigua]